MSRTRKQRPPALKKTIKITNQIAAVEKLSSGLEAILIFENHLATDLEKIKTFFETFLNSQTKKKFRAKSLTIPKRAAYLFILLGILFLIFPTVYKTYQTLRLPKLSLSALAPAKTNALGNIPSIKNNGPIKIDNQLLSKKEQSEAPSRIVVPSLNVDLPIIEAKVVNGYWELSETSASHGVGSANPGELGNTVVFAHARDDLFGPMRNIKQATSIYILTKDHWYKYQVEETKLVDPNEVQVIAPTKDEILTLYTCDGFFDSKRLIVTAKPVR